MIEAKPHQIGQKVFSQVPFQEEAGKTADFQTELKSMDLWSECFARLEAIFLARSFSIPVEPVPKGDVVVTDRPFIPPVQQTTGVTSQRQSTSQMQMKKATQPVEAPGAVTATQPVEASGAVLATRPVESLSVTSEMQPTSIYTCLLLLRDLRFSPQVLPARPSSVVDQRSNPQIPLVSLLLLSRNVPRLLPVLESPLRNRPPMQNSLVTVLQAILMKVRSLTWNLPVRIENCSGVDLASSF